MTSQNIYDDGDFFAAYSALDRSVDGLAGAPEWPALQSLLLDVSDARVVDLGCGFGWFARWAIAHGARSVLGLDLSERMLERARELTDDAAITYRRADLDTLELTPGSCELAFSSLTIHYLADLDRFLASVATALVPGGRLVISVEHPIFTAPTDPGFVTNADGRSTWPVDGYFDEAPRVTDWLAPGVVKHHRNIDTYLRSLRTAGFAVEDLVEWAPTPAQVDEHPGWAGERDRPLFLLLAATLAD